MWEKTKEKLKGLWNWFNRIKFCAIDWNKTYLVSFDRDVTACDAKRVLDQIKWAREGMRDLITGSGGVKVIPVEKLVTSLDIMYKTKGELMGQISKAIGDDWKSITRIIIKPEIVRVERCYETKKGKQK